MELPGSARHRWGKPRGSNGAFGKSDIEGGSSERVSHGREHISQPGKRTSFKCGMAMSSD
jgi:hypothetical protein